MPFCSNFPNKIAKCCDCQHENQIDWNRGITDLSGYCSAGDRYIKKHVNKAGINQSLHARRKCVGFTPKIVPDEMKEHA